MRKAAYGFAALGILAAAFYLVPRHTRGHVLYSFRLPPNKSPAYYESAQTALEAWLEKQGFARVAELRYEAPAAPPFTVVLAKKPGDLSCTFDWSYKDFSLFESEDHQRARILAAQLKAWRDAYLVQNP